MNLPVNLAGHPARWRFPGSPQIEELFASAPWSNGGGVHIVRTASGFGEEVSSCLAREVKAADNGLIDVRVIIFGSIDLDAGLEIALERVRRPGVDPAQASPERTDWLADWLTNQSTVLLIGPAPSGLGPAVLAETRDLHEWTLKKDSNRAITALVLDTREQRAGGGAIDLTIGWPVDSTLPHYAQSIARLWRAYLHARLAWETAGELSRAVRWSEAGFRGLADGDDGTVEQLLNKLASSDYRKLKSTTRKEFIDYVTGFIHPTRSRVDLLRRADALEESGLVWKPDTTGWPQPVPWVARAALCLNLLPIANFLFRGCLICRPLAREIQGRCLDLESRERAVCWGLKSTSTPHPEAATRWEDYSDDPTNGARMFYPTGCPAEPADSWPFTSFGEFLHATTPRSPQLSVWHELRELRNGLAHNHYLCWRVLTQLMDIEARLEP